MARAEAAAQRRRHRPDHARTCRGGGATKPGDIVTSHVRPDHRDPQHRRRRPADPVRRADLRRALRARLR
ncbi:MAG: hypothetical protein MZV65_48415 [Chromatiales bacterium]|nr:hypothetical protein [Chromatiales bacterium]